VTDSVGEDTYLREQRQWGLTQIQGGDVDRLADANDLVAGRLILSRSVDEQRVV
jgi:hypothetical protein